MIEDNTGKVLECFGSFHGSSTLWIYVEEETEKQFIGKKFAPTMNEPAGEVVINKYNIQGWKRDYMLEDKLKEVSEE